MKKYRNKRKKLANYIINKTNLGFDSVSLCGRYERSHLRMPLLIELEFLPSVTPPECSTLKCNF